MASVKTEPNSVTLFRLMNETFKAELPICLYHSKFIGVLNGSKHNYNKFPNYCGALYGSPEHLYEESNLINIFSPNRITVEIYLPDALNVISDSTEFGKSHLLDILSRIPFIDLSRFIVQVSKRRGDSYTVDNYEICREKENFIFNIVNSNNSVGSADYLKVYPDESRVDGHILLMGTIPQTLFFPEREASYNKSLKLTRGRYMNFKDHLPTAEKYLRASISYLGYNLIKNNLVDFDTEYLKNTEIVYNGYNAIISNKIGEPQNNLHTNRVLLNHYKSSVIDWATLKNPFDMYGFSAVFFKEDNILTSSSYNIHKKAFFQEADIYSKVSNYLSNEPTVGNCSVEFIPSNDNRLDPKIIEQKLDDLYDAQIISLKEKWDRISKRLKKNKATEYKIASMAIFFVVKYFIPRINNYENMTEMRPPRRGLSSAGRHPSHTEEGVLFIEKFFDDIYGDFTEFFNCISLSSGLQNLMRVSPMLSSYNNYNRRVSSLSPARGLPIAYLGRISEYIGSRESFYNSSRYKTCVIFNDSGTKNAWLKKARQYAKDFASRYPGSTILFMDPSRDIIEGAILKNILKDIDHIKMYSEFEKSIAVSAPTKRDPTDLIKIHINGDSHQVNLTESNIDKYIFMEYRVTKRMLKFEGQFIKETTFSAQELPKIFERVLDKKLAFVSELNYKKIKSDSNLSDRVVTLEDVLSDKNFVDNFQDKINDFYILSSKASSYYDRIFHSLNTGILQDITGNQSRVKYFKFWSLILNNLPKDIKELFGLMTTVTLKHPQSRYISRADIYREILVVDTNDGNSNDPILNKTLNVLFDKEGLGRNISDITTKVHDYLLKINAFSYGYNVFQISELISSHRQVLSYSKNLNLNKTDTKSLENNVLLTFLNKVRITTKKINEEYV